MRKKLYSIGFLVAESLFSIGFLASCGDRFQEEYPWMIGRQEDMDNSNEEGAGATDITVLEKELRGAIPYMISYTKGGGWQPHAYQYQRSNSIDNYAGYWTTTKSTFAFGGPLPTLYTFPNDYLGGPMDNSIFTQSYNAIHHAAELGKPEWRAVALIIQAYQGHEIIDFYGAAPFSDWRKLNRNPPLTYEKGEDVYEIIFNDLDEAIKILKERKPSKDEIAKIVSKNTGIPVSKLLKGDKEKVLTLYDTLSKRVIGQDQAIKLVSNAILRQRAGIQDANRPIGSFLFLGPTGVGKTEVAKALAEALFDNENNIIRLDMSEYMEDFTFTRLIGSPPGYVGFDQGGQLTEPVKRNPYSIVLFDEIEKAHPQIFNILLQILDDGRLTDSQGTVVDFKNTIIIMTSNIGSSEILEGHPERVDQLLRAKFKPEFLNRIDEIIYFNYLSKDVQIKIVDKMLKQLKDRLNQEYYSVSFSSNVKKYIIDSAYNEDFGARPIKRFIQNEIETFLAKEILANKINTVDAYLLDYENNSLVLKKQ